MILVEAARRIKEVAKPAAHRFAILEGHRDCNRSCAYCQAPSLYNRQDVGKLCL